MTGFELRISGIGSNHFSDWATITSPNQSSLNSLWRHVTALQKAPEKKSVKRLQSNDEIILAKFRASFSAFSIKLARWQEQCDQKKSPNFYKICPKRISLEKLKILTSLQKLPKNVGDLGRLIVANGFKRLPKVQKNRPIWSHWRLFTGYKFVLNWTKLGFFWFVFFLFTMQRQNMTISY